MQGYAKHWQVYANKKVVVNADINNHPYFHYGFNYSTITLFENSDVLKTRLPNKYKPSGVGVTCFGW